MSKQSINNILLGSLQDEDSGDLIRLVTADPDGEEDTNEPPEELLILPIKNAVLFPGVIIPITVSRTKSVRLV